MRLKKIMVLVLLGANIFSLQYYDSVKNKRDNFELCGSSLSVSGQTSEEGEQETLSANFQKQNKLSKHQTRNRLKEIIKDAPENFNTLVSGFHYNEIIHRGYIAFADDKIPENPYCKSIFRPS